MKRRGAIWLVVIASCCGGTLRADEPDPKKAEREARLQSMQQIAERFKVLKPDETEPVAMIASPLLRFDDPTRDFHDGTLWAWGKAGRPLCLLAIEQYGGQSWFECISLAEGKFTAEAEKLKWQPTEAGVTLQPLPEAPPPAKDAPRRLVQMKDALGGLAVHEVGRTGNRYELRLMPKPLHRYSNAEAELQDGALFAFAYGTNPELLAVIELRGPAEKPAWHVGFVRCGTAEPHVLLRDKELFTLPYATRTKPEDTYWNFAARFAEKK